VSYERGPGVRHWHSIGTLQAIWLPNLTVSSSSAVYPTADLAIYIPVVVAEPVVIRKLATANGTAVSGNLDVGVYDARGTRLVSAGTTAQSGTTTEQVIDVTDATIGPGLFYLAVTLDNTTGTFFRGGPVAPLAASIGILSEQLGTGAALPSTATWAVAQALAYIPHIAMLIEATAA